ncbi:MAG: peroxiredoxin [Desulfovibrio sp.]
MCFDHEQEVFMGLLETAHVGEPVDDFTLEAYDPDDCGFTEVSLKTQLENGRWTILFFYPADFTFVCPTELADLAEKHKALNELGCEIIAVSTDTKYSHMAWRQNEKMIENVKFKMASDANGELSRYFDVWDAESGLALRGTFIINPEGILVSSEINYYNVGRNADELKRKMDANIYLADAPAEVCPAKWTPGDKTLTPDDDMVGNVYEALSNVD